jgi:hypothetical protein
VIIDIVDITRKHSLITSADLFGLPANFDAKGDDLLDAKRFLEDAAKANPLADLTDVKSIDECRIAVIEVDLLGRFHDDVLDSTAALAWRKTGEGYEIDWAGELVYESVEVKKTDTGWSAAYKKGKNEHWKVEHATPEQALGAAEKFLYDKQRDIYAINKRNAYWTSQPATEQMRANILSCGFKLNTDNLTKGQARDLMAAHYSDRRKGLKK